MTLNNLKQIIIPAKNSLVLEVLLVSLKLIFYLPDYPQAVMGLREELVTVYSVQLEWAYQMNGSSPRTGVEIEVRRNDSLERTVMIGPESTTGTISSLHPLTTYSFTVFVVTDVGRSRPSSINNSMSLSFSMLNY